MSISPEIAAKVLEADLRNVVKAVSEGGKLSPSERQMMQNYAFPEGAAKTNRATNLIIKYAAGARLTASELAEVREVHPEFAPAAEPAPEQEASRADAPPAASPATPMAAAEITRAQLDRWGAQYGVQHRQLRRWIARGVEKQDPCPLDAPLEMPAWVEKNLENVRGKVRDAVNAAAEAARKTIRAEAPSLPPPGNIASTDDGGPQPAPAQPAAQPGLAPIDLTKVGGVEGESVELFRQLFGAAKLQLIAAYKDGDEERIRTLHARVEKTGESLRKHEIAAEQRAVRMGDYLDKATVLQEVAEALNTMRLLRQHRKKRIRAELFDVDEAILARLDAAIDAVGLREEQALTKLPVLRTTDALLLELAA